MCGIFFSLAVTAALHPSDALLTHLQRRGPDHCRHIERRIPVQDDGLNLHMVFYSTVLALRGRNIAEQPTISPSTGSIFLWNGEAWKLDGKPIYQNDTREIFEGLTIRSDAKAQTPSLSSTCAVHRLFSAIAGPFAFVYYDTSSSTVYFGRDATGRRSLMFRETADSFMLSSSSDPEHEDGWEELDPTCIYSIDIYKAGRAKTVGDSLVTRSCYHWQDKSPPLLSKLISDSSQSTSSSSSPPLEAYDFDRSNVARLRSSLLHSLHMRLGGIPTWKSKCSRAQPVGDEVLRSDATENIAILFSGGLDCTVLARLAHDLLPLAQPIALLNVAFENPRLAKNGAAKDLQYEACPDRVTARSALDELTLTCLGREWLFVAVNVTCGEMLQHRDQIISLMKPHDTEMDLSIAMALYFASRGVGILASSTDSITYSTNAQVLISGLGADELFGGYVRHENAFKRGGLDALVSELQLDIDRIGTRNLGRDDRVTSHWAKEIRYPFLDEDLVAWVVSLPVWQKCRFGVPMPQAFSPESEGIEAAKYILRLLAWDLGLKRTAMEKKRAIQFGSRSAKMFGRKTKGTDAISAV